ncbi:MAG: type III secretion system stalk subunit SctO [Geminicoccaceae bacterium]
MLAELEQLLTCRRERENRAAIALRQARLRLDRARADADTARKNLEAHHHERRARQDKLYLSRSRMRLSKRDVDGLNIELDLLAEKTDAFERRVREADATVGEAMQQVEEATGHFHRHRKNSERWNHLVKDVAETVRREREQAEEVAIEDDLAERSPQQQDWIA